MAVENILILDDNLANIQLLAELLQLHGYEVRPISQVRRAVDAIDAAPPDLILLDVNMPDMNGYEVCALLKENEATRDIPVLFLSALDEMVDKVRGFEVGGVDYITKPFQPREVLARIRTHLQISEQRREIAALRQWEVGYLQQFNQMKDDLLRMVSHDLKNPLGVIKGYGELLHDELEDEGRLSEDVARHLEMIQRASENILDQIQRLVDIAQTKGAVQILRRQVTLAPYLKGLTDLMRFTAEQKGVILTNYLPDSSLQVAIAPERLKQAILNLIANAIKYSYSGGLVEVAGGEQEGRVWIAVRDSGIGIPSEALPALTQPNYQVNVPEHQALRGSGLGLAIVQTIVEHHDGEMTIDSVPGEGSTFTIWLPMVEK